MSKRLPKAAAVPGTRPERCPECHHTREDEHYPDCRYFVLETDDDDVMAVIRSFPPPPENRAHPAS